MTDAAARAVDQTAVSRLEVGKVEQRPPGGDSDEADGGTDVERDAVRVLDTCLQALVYERGARYDPGGDNFEEYDRLDEFFATSEPRLSTGRGRTLFERVREKYEAAKGEK